MSNSEILLEKFKELFAELDLPCKRCGKAERKYIDGVGFITNACIKECREFKLYTECKRLLHQSNERTNQRTKNNTK